MNTNKSFFLTVTEYNSVKNSVNFKNFNRVPNNNKVEGEFWFYSKTK